MRVLVGLAALVTLAACYSPSTAVGVPCSSTGECPSGQHCDHASSPPTCSAADARPIDAPPDAPPACATSGDCAETAPFCDPATRTCRACAADSECGDGACVEHLGTCVSAANVLFASPSGAPGADCSKAAPCTVDYAIGIAANNQRTIALVDGTYSTQVSIQNLGANALAISGPDPDPDGVLLIGGIFVENTQREILVEGVTVTVSSARGIDNRGTLTLSRVAVEGCANDGIASINGGTLRIVDSRIANNMNVGLDVSQTTLELSRTIVSGNRIGAITISNAATTIENTVISNNGTLFGFFAAVRYQNLNGKPQVFAHNTVANNQSSVPPAGVVCAGTLVLDSSILVDSVGMGCMATYSLFAGMPPAGMGNVMGDPQFVAAGDYHISATSPARDAANPAAAATRDIDGELRPQGTGRDIGADEVP